MITMQAKATLVAVLILLALVVYQERADATRVVPPTAVSSACPIIDREWRMEFREPRPDFIQYTIIRVTTRECDWGEVTYYKRVRPWLPAWWLMLPPGHPPIR